MISLLSLIVPVRADEVPPDRFEERRVLRVAHGGVPAREQPVSQGLPSQQNVFLDRHVVPQKQGGGPPAHRGRVPDHQRSSAGESRPQLLFPVVPKADLLSSSSSTAPDRRIVVLVVPPVLLPLVEHYFILSCYAK
jgi:hypothetical protein